MTINKWHRIAFLISLFCFFSCIKGTQTITLKKNGSAFIELNFEVTETQEKLFAISQKSFLNKQKKPYKILDKQKIRNNLSKKYKGIELTSFQRQVSQDKIFYKLKIKVKNLSNAFSQKLLPQMSFKEYKKNQWSFMWDLPKTKTPNLSFIKGLNLTLVLNSSEKIIDSNAHKKKEKTVSWSINENNFKKITQEFSFFSALIEGDYSLEKQIIEEQQEKLFLGID